MHASENVCLGASGGGSYDGKIAGLYDLEETLGSGHFAVVKLARHVFTGAKVAVKVVDKTKLDEVSKAHLFQEVRCMKLVQHPNVVRLYEVIDTQTKLYLVLELGDGGDLYDYIMKHEGGLNEELARKYFRQIVRAISYCHQLHVVHRDLKPENVVFFEKLGVVKLTDFGFSNKFSPGQKLETSCGSLAYSAPEILLGDSYDAPAVDIWSLGVILYMLVCGQPPFERANDSETLTMIMDCKYTVPPHISIECRNLIGSMLVRDPEKRSNLEEISKDPWLQENSSNETFDNLPLVSRGELSEEDHAFIVQKMINGNIASKEEITQSLDKNKYNHITATYFLLGEIRLRKRREEKLQKRYPQQTISKLQNDNNKILTTEKKQMGYENKFLVPINIEVCSPNILPAEFSQDKRIRKCSIVREEDEDESACEYTTSKYELKVAVSRRESISDGRLNQSVTESALSIPPTIKPHINILPSANVCLVENVNPSEKINDSTKNEISETTNLNVTAKSSSMCQALSGIKAMKINKFKHIPTTSTNPVLSNRKTKLNKIRTPSCSSSEASDDDTKIRNKKKMNKFVGDTPSRIRMHRRDSHDDSSDSQDPSTLPSSSAGNKIGSRTSHSGEKKDKRKPDDTKKSSSSHSKQKKPLKEQEMSLQRSSYITKYNLRRRRIRANQSLDRITESQEYDRERHRCLNGTINKATDNNTEFSHNTFNLSSSSAKEEELSELFEINIHNTKTALSTIDNAIQMKRNMETNRTLNSIDARDLIIDVTNITKAIQVAGSKCYGTFKKIRSLGKFFPVVNFS